MKGREAKDVMNNNKKETVYFHVGNYVSAS